MRYDREHPVTAVVPVYCAQDHILRFHHRLLQVLERSFRAWEILYVDDCSGDDTCSLLQEIQMQCSRVSLIVLPENLGQQRATHCGILHARYPQVVTLDDDGQSDPGDIPALYDMMISGGYDCVYGIPEGRIRAVHRSLGTSAVDLALRISVGKPADLQVSSFRMLSESCTRRLSQVHARRPYLSAEILLSSGSIGNLPVRHASHDCTTRYSLSRLCRVFLQLILGYRRASWKRASRTIEYAGVLRYTGKEFSS